MRYTLVMFCQTLALFISLAFTFQKISFEAAIFHLVFQMFIIIGVISGALIQEMDW